MASLPENNLPNSNEPPITADFVRQQAIADLQGAKVSQIVTRFPPEPNGYLHVGHAKSICLNFGIAQELGGTCHLRLDDTNPMKEDQEYIDAIMSDVSWLGFDWADRLYYASDYFPQLYEWAIALIKADKAYVCDLSGEEITRYRGTLREPGRPSADRNRSADENLALFEQMKNGAFPNGSRTLRAKIDMASPNLNLRDPVMYRILHAGHPKTGDQWCIYPMYDWAHGQSDWIEGITHSICTLEFENHRPLYDWFIDTLIQIGQRPTGVTGRPRQIEFARLNLTYMLMSKRKLLELVKAGHVSGWDDPRMPTLRGIRRRGYTAAAIRRFVTDVGVTKFDSVIDIARLENTLREDLNKTAPRRLGVLRPIKLVIDNYPQGQSEQLEAINNPEDPAAGTRQVPFSRELYIEQEDFAEVPPPKYFRLSPGREVRLRYAYFVTCTHTVKDAQGNITEIHCTYDPATRGGDAPDGRKVKGTIHWVSAQHAIDAPVRLYDHLFNVPDPENVPEGQTYLSNLNPESLITVNAKLEPSLRDTQPGQTVQFERHGYFVADPIDSQPGAPVFNRAVTLKDSWGKGQKK